MSNQKLYEENREADQCRQRKIVATLFQHQRQRQQQQILSLQQEERRRLEVQQSAHSSPTRSHRDQTRLHTNASPTMPCNNSTDLDWRSAEQECRRQRQSRCRKRHRPTSPSRPPYLQAPHRCPPAALSGQAAHTSWSHGLSAI